MKLTFFGAAKAVTGSCHCLDVNGKRILIDCGLQQGKDEYDNNALPFAANEVDYVLVTHAHIDHSARLPLMVKEGFQGQVVTTTMTAKLMDIMLRDSAGIQESDAQWKTRKGKRAGMQDIEPLYTTEDAENVLKLLKTYKYDQEFELCEGVKVRFRDAGHLLGSAIIEIWLNENGSQRKLVFSGDLGNVDQPVICDPVSIQGADYVIMESTYGDRVHDIPKSYTGDLAKIIDDAFARGGNVVIPAFAVGRTQEVLYYIREIKEKHLCKTAPDNFEVVVDSPLAEEATTIYSGDLTGYLDEEARELLQGGGRNLFVFPGLRLTKTSEESKSLNEDGVSRVIISASGMCDAGRIRHHLKHNLWRPECTICFVGYQAEGSLGRRLLDGSQSVKLFGEQIAVKARIVNFPGFSSHADSEHLLAWAKNFTDPKPKHIFVVHGDAEVTEIFAQKLRDSGFEAHAPLFKEEWDLLLGQKTADGIVIEQKPVSTGAAKANAAYARLVDVTNLLEATVAQSRGRSNKDLARLTDQIKRLLDQWNAAG